MLLLALAAAISTPDSYAERVRPVLEARCFGCHSGAEPEGDLGLDALAGEAATEGARWTAVRRRVLAGEMPPEGEPALEAGERDALLGWIDAVLGPDAGAESAADVARLRRLNRREIANTVRDLYGVAIDPDELPPDDVGHGFDTIAAVLATSELLLERHLELAERVAAQAVPLPEDLAPRSGRVDGADLQRPGKSGARGTALSLNTNAAASIVITVRRDGEYALRAGLWGNQAGPEPCRASLSVDGRELVRADVPEEVAPGRTVETTVRLRAGAHAFAVAFLNDYYRPEAENGERDRNLIVGWLELEGPFGAPRTTPFQAELAAHGAARPLEEIVPHLLRSAWRRPASPAEVERVLALARAEPDREHALRAALTAALVSPFFLHRLEDAGELARPDHRLAANLSYFLWSSAPDAELARRADLGLLANGALLRVEVRRLLDDARAVALAEGFAVQWLQLGRLERAAPDPARFPDFDAPLRDAMLGEAVMVFDAVLRENRPARALLQPGFTFVDERLAAHYGLGGVRGSALRRVPVDDGLRGGVLGLAAVLTATSNPTRTSPSSRGKFVLEALLDDPPPPPPPGVGVLDESHDASNAASFRARLERHRTDPACNVCHARIDPLGLGLETLDATGRWRARDGRFDIDTAGVLPDGRAFAGPAELQALVAADPRFVRALFEKLAIYALGRGLDDSDDAWIDAALARAGREPALARLVEELVLSPGFRAR